MCRIVILGLLKLKIKPDTTCPNSWQQTFNQYMLLPLRWWDIDWGWNIFTVHNFLSMLIEHTTSSLSASEKRELRTWNLGQIFKIKQWTVGQKYSRWKSNCSKTLQIESRSSLCQCRHQYFICYQFGCKLWLWSLNYHDSSLNYHDIVYNLFARLHLKLLCCLSGIWADSADALF